LEIEDSMSDLKFKTLRAVNVTRCRRWHPPESTPWTCADWSNALCGEAGESANVVKKIRRQQTGARNESDPIMEQLIKMEADELADVVIYADLLAHHFGIDLGAAVKAKFNKVSEKYGFPERLA
jgi:NTP pyrophosphatase (non-canonical NTP hydrolase)